MDILSSVYDNTHEHGHTHLKQNHVPPATNTRPSLNLFTIRILALEQTNERASAQTETQNAPEVTHPNQLIKRDLRWY
jgi:hypothetical protein